ncbi:MAG: arginine repressor [Propionibacterium sp.]|nr:arginine repressor [Propionibacterium sp.]MDN6566684.1 arginine repressor [Actinomyces sp.]MDN6794382.1 arginine repressor [Propionibacterium sp.]
MTHTTIPATKTARRGTIIDILASRAITSQEELRRELADLGVETTQATLSRDLLEMRATKVRNAQGVQVYSVPDADGSHTHQAEASQARLVRWCQDLLVATDLAGNLLVLRTPVGAANLLGSAIDAVRMEGIAGTIAGDDTVLVICRTPSDARRVETSLLELADPGSSPATRPEGTPVTRPPGTPPTTDHHH